MPKQYYEKDARGNFVEVGYEFTGFPSNGVWFVEDGKNNCIVSLGDRPTIPNKTLISYMVFQDELQEHITKTWSDRALSQRDLAIIACEFFAKKAGGMEVAGEIIEN